MPKLHEKSLLGIRCYGYNTYRGAQNLNYPDNVDNFQPAFLESDTKSSTDALLDSIFAVDPLTKLPSGDISVFLSKNTSDSVKKFIQDNLLADNGVKADSSKYPDLPDSVIADYTRSSDETAYQYRDRILSVMRSNYNEYHNKSSKDGDKS